MVEERVGQGDHVAFGIGRRERGGGASDLGQGAVALPVRAPGGLERLGIDEPASGIRPGGGGGHRPGDMGEEIALPQAAALLAGGEQRHAAVARLHRGMVQNLVAGEVVKADPASPGPQVRDDIAPQIAPVEAFGTRFRKPPERLCQARNPQPRAGLQRHPVGQEDRGGDRIAAQDRHFRGDHQRAEPASGNAILGQPDCRLQHFSERPPAIAAKCVIETGHRAGHRHGGGALGVGEAADGGKPHRGGRQRRIDGIVPGGGAQGEGPLEIEGDGTGLPRQPDHHEAAAADPAHPGLYRAERERCRNGGIHRIAPLAEQFGPGPCGRDVLGSHHAVRIRDVGFAGVPLIRRRGHRSLLTVRPGLPAGRIEYIVNILKVYRTDRPA